MPKLHAIPAVDRHDSMRIKHKTGETFGVGALVVLDGNGEVTECGADPASIYGVALEGAGKDPEGQYTIVAKSYEGQKFWLECSTAPAFINQNKSYGVTKDADGIWHVDLAKTAASARVFVHQVDSDTGRVLVSVLAANRQIAP